MTKKPALGAGTPDDEKRNSLIDEHDFLTDRFDNPDHPNRVLAVVELAITEAGGRDTAGNRVTKVGIVHVEHADDEKSEAEIEKLFSKLYKARTGEPTRPSLIPEPDTALEGMSHDEVTAGSGDDLPAVEA